MSSDSEIGLVSQLDGSIGGAVKQARAVQGATCGELLSTTGTVTSPVAVGVFARGGYQRDWGNCDSNARIADVLRLKWWPSE